MRGAPSVEAAEELAPKMLERLGKPLGTHARGGGVRPRADPAVRPVEDRPLQIVAAWWHVLGYAPPARNTGCQQIDGARYLAREGYPKRMVALVAHHSAATSEAEERGLLAELRVWPREQSPVADALWTADMSTGPRGEALTYDERLTEILPRYHRDSVVGRAMLGPSQPCVPLSSAPAGVCSAP